MSDTANPPTTGISRTCIYTAAGRAIGARDPACGATPNFQFPTTNHSQLPTANNAQRTPEQIEVGNWKSGVVGNWELEVGSGWELGVGSSEFSQFVRPVPHITIA